MNGIIIYYCVSALLMCILINLSLNFDKDQFLQKECNKVNMPIKKFIVLCTILGFIALPYTIWSCLRNTFRK